MDELTDRVLGRLVRGALAARLQSPSVGLLAEARAWAAADVRARHEEEARRLASRADEGDREAAIRYGALAQQALEQMRSEVRRRARAYGPAEGLFAAVHERFGDTDETEYLDDPDLDPALRVELLANLDAFNTVVGSYRAFLDAMRPLCQGPTRVLDLAAGHGGFALAAARVARDEDLPLEITATDIKPEYLALGRESARREALDVSFEVQDALDLSNLEPGAYDVVVCTQSLHHFPASMVARMFREAARAAGRGVVFIDGCRSLLSGLLVPTLGVMRYRNSAFAHDAWVSVRRAFVPEELGLLATLGPEADAVEAEWMQPAHCLLRWTR